jgi:hypothetical protein
VYSVTRDFPADERFGLTNQMRRAAVSVSSNIAEGSSRISKKDFARFIEIAMGSPHEVIPKTSSLATKALSARRLSHFFTLPPRNKAECSAVSAAPCCLKIDFKTINHPPSTIHFSNAHG